MKNIKETLLILIVIVSLFLSIGVFNLKERQKALKNEAALKLNILRNSLTKLSDDFNDKEKSRAQLEKRLDELTTESSSLEIQISQIKQAYDDSEYQLVAVEEDMALSRGRMKDLMNEKMQLVERISSAESEIGKLQERLDTLRQTTAALDRHVKNMQRVNVNRQEQEQQMQPQELAQEEPAQTTMQSNIEPASRKTMVLQGEVLVVNREFNFIVVNLGKQDGIEEGDTLKVYDGDKLLGSTRVETVRENISAASGGKDLDAYRIRPGNKVYAGSA